MTDLLVRIFIKNRDKIDDIKVRTAYGILASVVGIFCNICLFGLKLFVGVLLNSVAVMADAFNNLTDAASSVISMIGIKIAEKPADQKHPFGHGRMEYIAAFVISFLVIQVGFNFLKDSIQKIRNPEEITFQMSSLIILLSSIVIKLWLGLFNRKLGKRIHSSVMQATAADAFGDLIITSVAVLSIIVSHISDYSIDGYVGLLVSLFIMWNGIGIARETLEPIIGQAVPTKVYKMITEKVESYNGIVGSHDLIVHNYGPSRNMATIHAEVPKDVDIEVSHELIDQIERDVYKEMGIFLVIHMDPIEVRDEKVLKIRERILEEVQKIDEKFSIHDFRYISGKNHVNLIFDLVVPRTYLQENDDSLKRQINKKMKKIDKRYQCIITVERSFVYEEP